MTDPIYHVDAEIKASDGTVLRDFHLETPNEAEAEHWFLDCWFSRKFWDVRIWKEWGKEIEG